MKVITVFVLLITISIVGCGTVVHGGWNQTIGIATNPVGARIMIEGQEYTSPALVELSRKQSYTGSADLEGYKTEEFTIKNDVSGWSMGNLVFGPFSLIGFFIDGVSGGAYNLTPENITIDMKPQSIPS